VSPPERLGTLLDTDDRTLPIPQVTMAVTDRQTNLALLLLLVAALASGTVLFALGTRWALAALITHGVVGLGVVLTTPWKQRIIRRGLATRSARSTWPSIVLGVLVVVTVMTGVLHSAGLVRSYGPLDDMQLHVGAALLALPFTVWHVMARRVRPQRTDVTRRNVLRLGMLASAAGATFAGLEGIIRVAGLPGADRRFTGSFEQGSHDPASMPSIIWLSDPRPDIDESRWRLRIADGTGERRLDYATVAGHDDRLTATIDCTTGWFAEQDWTGVRLARLLTVPDGARSVVVRSSTGYSRRFPIGDVEHLLLATGYEGRPLANRHGFPLRLVAPGRRGFWWVKWVTDVETSDAPSWVQPYFPLQ